MLGGNLGSLLYGDVSVVKVCQNQMRTDLCLQEQVYKFKIYSILELFSEILNLLLNFLCNLSKINSV